MEKQINTEQIMFASLQKMFPGRLLLTVAETAKLYGLQKNYIYNRIHKNAKHPFPIEPIRPSGRPMFRLHDIAKDLASNK